MNGLLDRLGYGEVPAYARRALTELTDTAAWRAAGREQYALFYELLDRGQVGGRFFQRFVAVFLAFVGVGNAIVQGTPVATSDPRMIATSLAVSVVLIAMGLWWRFAPFPTFAQCLAFIAAGDVLVLVNSLVTFAEPTARIALTGFLLPAGLLVGFAYGWRILLLHLIGSALTIGTVTAVVFFRCGLSFWEVAPFAGISALIALAIPVSMQFVVDFGRLQAVALSEESIRDPLTGLLNRRGWELQAARFVARCPRSHELVVIALDVDRFKLINDTQATPGATSCCARSPTGSPSCAPTGSRCGSAETSSSRRPTHRRTAMWMPSLRRAPGRSSPRWVGRR